MFVPKHISIGGRRQYLHFSSFSSEVPESRLKSEYVLVNRIQLILVQ